MNYVVQLYLPTPGQCVVLYRRGLNSILIAAKPIQAFKLKMAKCFGHCARVEKRVIELMILVVAV